jgi:hypothetical protein
LETRDLTGAVVALIATLQAFRASRIDPMVVLRL